MNWWNILQTSFLSLCWKAIKKFYSNRLLALNQACLGRAYVALSEYGLFPDQMRIFIALMAVFAAVNTLACDGCSLFLGIQPNDRQNALTFMYRYRFMEGDILPESLAKHAGHGGSTITYGKWKELQTVYELRGRVFVGERFYALGVMPVVNNYRSINGKTNSDVYGVGDPIFMGNYILFNSKSTLDSLKFRHRLTVGAGTKFPLGTTDKEVDGEVPDLDMQPGTGSWDALFSLEYMLRYNKTGINTNLVYNLNNKNNDGYAYGDGLSARLDIFHLVSFKTLSIMPSISAYVECMKKDEEDGVAVLGTGGTSIMAGLGLKAFYRQFALQVQWLNTVHNDLGTYVVPNKDRIIVGLTYNFN